MKKIIVFILVMIILAGCAPVPSLVSVIKRVNVPGDYATISAALNAAQPGWQINVQPGTYNEALTLKTSGTADAPISLYCTTPKGCTINSGGAKTITAGGKAISYYTIDGFRLISTMTPSASASSFDASIDLQGPWVGYYDKNGGNNGYSITNCYVEGAIRFYGHNNLVENCEFNGLSKRWQNGVSDAYGASHHNTYRNNYIYNYGNRGIWSMQVTEYILMESNRIVNSGKCIDADGAGIPVYYHTIRGNTFESCNMGIELENAFESLVEGNLIKSGTKGIHVSGTGNGPDFFTENKIEYRHLDTHTIIRNNIIYAGTQEGVTSTAQTGLTFVNNTIYYTSTPAGYYSGLDLSTYYVTGTFPSNNWTVKNNVIIDSNAALINTGTSGLAISHNFYKPNARYIFKNTSVSPSIFTINTFEQWQYNTASLTGDPLFKSTDPSSPDFLRPSAGSPLCTGGENGGYMGAYPCAALTPTYTPLPASPTLTPTGTNTPVPNTVTSQPTVTATKTVTVTPSVTSSQTSIPPTATETPAPTATATPECHYFTSLGSNICAGK